MPKETETGRGVLIIAEEGIGKTALLDVAAVQAAQRGMQTLRMGGARGERDLTFSGLHQLLWPVLSRADSLPRRQRYALHAAFGLEGEAQPHRPDRLLLGLATLTLLSDLAAEAPLLIVADDAHWIDPGSLGILSFLARRLEGEPVSILAACRTEAVPEHLNHALYGIAVGPLDEAAAHALLDAQPAPPSGTHRTRILQYASGNPLALVELASLTESQKLTMAPLPVSRRIEDLYASQLAALPSVTRAILLLAAAADNADLSIVLDIIPEATDPLNWQYAEQAGLIRIDGRSITFRHPLIRSVVYQAASQAERQHVHTLLAKAFSQDFDRQAWHRAAAAFGPDDDAAAALDKTAERAVSRNATLSAATAFEYAASLSSTPLQKAQRLMKAAGVLAGDDQIERANELARQAARITTDGGLRCQAEMLHGWALAASLRQTEAFIHLMATAQSVLNAAPEAALEALAVSAAVANHGGVDEHRQQVDEALQRMPLVDELPRLWISTVINPHIHRDDALAAIRTALAPQSSGSPREQLWLSEMAWLLDETSTALHFGRVSDPLAHDRPEYRNRQMALTYGWACLEHGWWVRTRAVVREANDVASARPFGRAELYMLTLEANLCALQGDIDRAHHLGRQIFSLAADEPVRQIRARTHWATGLAHSAANDHDAAFMALRRMFHLDGGPLHFHASPYAVADLAEAAVRSGHTEDARNILCQLHGSLPAKRSKRLNGRLLHAQALLDDSGRADELFRAALANDRLKPWPFEHAQTRLAHGQWLRRNGRINDARAPLNHALTTFKDLGASPWEARAAAELRASGVTLNPPIPSALNHLSAQQQQIARLAAGGMTNREIGERLFLSPRTVGHHLYRVFPKLGITSRYQLRDFVRSDEHGF